MDCISKIKSLTDELLKYCHEYYDLDRPSISDKEYDAKYDMLKQLEDQEKFWLPNSPTRKVQGHVLTGFQKVIHSKPMLSAAKTKNTTDVIKFVDGKKFYCSYKLDGLTMVVIYDNGYLQKAVTRGDGYIGEDVTAQAKRISNLPIRIPFDGHLELRGECVISLKQFERINSALDEPYSHPRNLAAGTIRQLNTDIVQARGLSYVVFECVLSDHFNSKLDALKFVDSLGFETVNRCVAPTVDECTKKMPADIYKYPVDGLIFELDDIQLSNRLGRTSHHENCRIALKWVDTTQETVLRNVEWNTSRNGILTPVAVFDEIDLDGAKTTKATLHNLSIIEQLQLGIGDIITVYRSNMVIPKIDDNLTRSNTLDIPSICPCCGAETQVIFTDHSKMLSCPNRLCPSKTLAQFTHLVSRSGLNIDGLSERTLCLLLEHKLIHTYKDIYHLSECQEQLVQYNGFGPKSVRNLLEAIEQSRHIKLENYLYALGINGLGMSAAKTIAQYFNGDYQQFIKAIRSHFDFSTLDGVGESLNNAILTYMDTNDLYEGLADELLFFSDTEYKTNKINGMKFCITGSFPEKREVLRQKLESAGAKFVSGVSKNVDVLFAGENAGSKLVKAKQLGVQILHYNDLIEMIT